MEGETRRVKVVHGPSPCQTVQFYLELGLRFDVSVKVEILYLWSVMLPVALLPRESQGVTEHLLVLSLGM